MNKSARKALTSRLLITMPWGIGDAIHVGLSAVDQIILNDPGGHVTIDVLCNHAQAPIFEHDPRIHELIVVDGVHFPTAAEGTWKRGIFLSPEALQLATYLRRQHYTAVLPIFFGPSFFYQLRTPIMFLNVREAWKVIAMLRSFQDMPLQRIVRYIINKNFGDRAPEPKVDEPIPLYLHPEHIHKARQYVVERKRQAGLSLDHSPWLLVAPDTSSDVTRPPTPLLAEGIAGALKDNPNLCVEILPGYTDTQAACKLWHALAPQFPDRIFRMPAEPQMPLLELAAFIDQSDIFLTGDTCTMHLAAASKTLSATNCTAMLPRNSAKIIALFGGTNPGLHGYSKRSTIIGKGRKEQTAFAPGIAKEGYCANGKDLFDHVSSHQITSAILS